MLKFLCVFMDFVWLLGAPPRCKGKLPKHIFYNVAVLLHVLYKVQALIKFEFHLKFAVFIGSGRLLRITSF